VCGSWKLGGGDFRVMVDFGGSNVNGGGDGGNQHPIYNDTNE